jgi:hypothetical protein
MKIKIAYFTKFLIGLLSNALLVGSCSQIDVASTSTQFPSIEAYVEILETEQVSSEATVSPTHSDAVETSISIFDDAIQTYEIRPDTFILEVGPRDNSPITLCHDFVSEGQFYWLESPFDQITPVFNDEGYAYYDATWSPSREQFAYIRVDVSSYIDSYPNEFPVRRDFPGDSIWVYSMEGGSTRQIGPVFTRWERMNVDGSQCESHPDLPALISWSPDEAWVFFLQFDSQGTNLNGFIVNVDTSEILDLGKIKWNYVWLPDSSGLLAVDGDSNSIMRYLIDEQHWDPDFSIPYPPTLMGFVRPPFLKWNSQLDSFISDARQDNNEYSFWYLTEELSWSEFQIVDTSNMINLWEFGDQYAFICSTDTRTEQKEIVIYEVDTWSRLGEITGDDFKCLDLKWLEYRNGEALLIILRDYAGYSVDVYSISQGEFALLAQLSLDTIDLIQYVPDLDLNFNLEIYRVK